MLNKDTLRFHSVRSLPETCVVKSLHQLSSLCGVNTAKFYLKLAKMFNPNAQAAKKAEKAAKKKALAELKAYTESLVPQDIHEGVKCY